MGWIVASVEVGGVRPRFKLSGRIMPNRGPDRRSIEIRTPAVARREDQIETLTVRPYRQYMEQKTPLSSWSPQGAHNGSRAAKIRNYFQKTVKGFLAKNEPTPNLSAIRPPDRPNKPRKLLCNVPTRTHVAFDCQFCYRFRQARGAIREVPDQILERISAWLDPPRSFFFEE